MKQRPLSEVLQALEQLAKDRGWIVDNLVKFHAGHLILAPATFANYASSIANLEARQRDLERELSEWVLAHKAMCIINDRIARGEEEVTVISDEFRNAINDLKARYGDDYYAELKATKPERDEP